MTDKKNDSNITGIGTPLQLAALGFKETATMLKAAREERQLDLNYAETHGISAERLEEIESGNSDIAIGEISRLAYAIGLQLGRVEIERVRLGNVPYDTTLE